MARPCSLQRERPAGCSWSLSLGALVSFCFFALYISELRVFLPSGHLFFFFLKAWGRKPEKAECLSKI